MTYPARNAAAGSDALPESRLEPAMPAAQLITLAQVAERLQLGHTSVDLLVRRGKLRVVRFGRAVRVTEAALADCVAEMEAASTQAACSGRSVVDEILAYERESLVRSSAGARVRTT